MSFVKTILKWEEEKFNEIKMSDKHPCAKAFACGMIEGAIDGAVLMFPFLVAGCIYWRKKATK